jgi:hypothetical protein
MVFYAIMLLPIVAAVLSLMCLLLTGNRVALIITLVANTVSASVWGAAAWLFKDGLGPGFVPSTGITAVLRFVQLSSLPLVILGALSVVAILVYRGKSRVTNA